MAVILRHASGQVVLARSQVGGLEIQATTDQIGGLALDTAFGLWGDDWATPPPSAGDAVTVLGRAIRSRLIPPVELERTDDRDDAFPDRVY